MIFDLGSMIPVRQREDGLMEKDTFDVSTAKPISDIPQMTAGDRRYVHPLSDFDKAKSLVEYTNAINEKKSGSKAYADAKWSLSSDAANDNVAAIANVLVTGGAYPVVQGIRGALDAEGDYNLMDRIYKGIMHPEETARLTDKLAVENEPAWAGITRSVAEDVLSYGAVGAVKAVVKPKLFARDIARRIESAADDFVASKIGTATGEEGVLTGKQAQKVASIDDMKAGFIESQISRLSALEVIPAEGLAQETAKTSGRMLYDKKSMLDYLTSELSNITVKPRGFGVTVVPAVRVGQTCAFKSEGKELVGKIIDIVGKRATIDMDGHQVVAMLSQLSVNPPKDAVVTDSGLSATEVKPETSAEAFLKANPNATAEEYVASMGTDLVWGDRMRRKGENIYEYKLRNGQTYKTTQKFSVGDEAGDSVVSLVKSAGKGVRGHFSQEESIKYISEHSSTPDVASKAIKNELGIDISPDDIASKYQTLVQKLLSEFNEAKGKVGGQTPPPPEKPTAVSPGEPELPKEIEKSILEQGVESLFSIKLKPNEVKAIIRKQTGQTQSSKELLSYLKEKYAYQIKQGELEQEIEQKLATPLKASKVKGIVKESTGQNKSGEKVVDERQALRETLKAQVKAASRADRATREQIYDIQSTMIDVINQSDLDANDKAKFLSTIKNANTPAHFEKLLPQIEERITALEQKAEKRMLVADIKKVAKRAKESSSISIDYADAIESLLSRFDLKPRTKELERAARYIEQQISLGKGSELPEALSKKLDRLLKKPISDMTNDDLKKLLADIEQMESVGKTKKRLKDYAYERDKNEIKARLVSSANAIRTKAVPNVPIGKDMNSMATRYIGLLNYISKTNVGLTPIEGLADITGMQDMKNALDASFGEYLVYNDKNIKEWYDLTKNFTEGNFKRIGAYAIAQQEGGMDRLIASGRTKAEIDAIELTKEEQAAYEFARQTFDKMFPDIKNYVRDVYNEDVGQVDNYVSFMADNDSMNDLQQYDKFGNRVEAALQPKPTKTVEQGFTESRAKTATYPIELNIDKIFRRHIDDVAYMLTMGKNIKMHFEVINSKEMREAMGDLATLAWLQYLDLMARKGGSEASKRLAALDIARRNLSVGVLGFKLSSILVQFTSFGDTMATIGAEWATKGASNISTSREWRDFVMDNFPEVRKAVGDDIAFREFGDTWTSQLATMSMKPLQLLDGLMRSTAASGAYEKLAKERGIKIDLKNPDKQLIADATKIMRQSQGSSFFKDQPLALTTGFGLADNRSLNKTLLTFQSFMLGRWDNINRQIWRMGIKEKNFGKAFWSAFWMMTVAFAGEEYLRGVANKITGKKKPKKKDRKTITQGAVDNAIRSVPLMGQLASAITYSSMPIPIVSAAQDAIEGASYAINGQTKKTRKKGTIKAFGAAAALAGVPGATAIAQYMTNKIKTK